MSEPITFETVLEKHADSDATGITIPFDVEKTFGAKRVPVKISINGADYRSTIFKMNGKYLVAIPKVFRAAAKINAGEKISVKMQRDTEKRTVEIPADLSAALKKNELTDVFAKLSFTHQKEYVRAVEEAKKEETRVRRIEKTVEQLISKRK